MEDPHKHNWVNSHNDGKLRISYGRNCDTGYSIFVIDTRLACEVIPGPDMEDSDFNDTLYYIDGRGEGYYFAAYLFCSQNQDRGDNVLPSLLLSVDEI